LSLGTVMGGVFMPFSTFSKDRRVGSPGGGGGGGGCIRAFCRNKTFLPTELLSHD